MFRKSKFIKLLTKNLDIMSLKKKRFNRKHKNNPARLIFLNLQILSDFKLILMLVIELKDFKTFKENKAHKVRLQNLNITPQLESRRKCKEMKVQAQKVQHLQVIQFKVNLKVRINQIKVIIFYNHFFRPIITIKFLSDSNGFRVKYF